MAISSKLNTVARQNSLNTDTVKAALGVFLRKHDIKGKPTAKEGTFGIEESNVANILKFCETLKEKNIITKMPYLEGHGVRDHIRFFIEDQEKLVRTLFGETVKAPMKKAKPNMK